MPPSPILTAIYNPTVFEHSFRIGCGSYEAMESGPSDDDETHTR